MSLAAGIMRTANDAEKRLPLQKMTVRQTIPEYAQKKRISLAVHHVPCLNSSTILPQYTRMESRKPSTPTKDTMYLPRHFQQRIPARLADHAKPMQAQVENQDKMHVFKAKSCLPTHSPSIRTSMHVLSLVIPNTRISPRHKVATQTCITMPKCSG